MAPSRSSSSTSTHSSTAQSSAESVSTTTIFNNPTGIANSAADSNSHSSSNSATLIGPIVGGVLGGVALAIVAVVAWHLWGRSIKRKEDEKKRETMAFLNLRDNTRKNASAALEKGIDSYTTYTKPSLPAGRTVKFSSSSSESNQSTVKSYMSENLKEKEAEKEVYGLALDSPPAAKQNSFRGPLLHAPVKSSPLARRDSSPPLPEEPKVVTDVSAATPRTPSPEYSETDQPTDLPTQTGGLRVPQLAHKTSKASSLSMYSTQSGEEHQQLVPPSLIMAAFRRPDPRRPLVDSMRHSSAPSAFSFDESFSERNRLSNISSGSEYLQQGDESDSPTDAYVAR
ncbi:hypothetical protein BDY19DRAFT_995685 [Irpex rosettiformis]|uniref:Uncharacterized protein n=1 Tax=Irpex rosettiformis TaxID=378272 RepID=A0ACB8TXA8_9APHY|nr:hypothetical protein BDY19DRAFT_995685 [Irpex rosettiformis]